MIAPMRTKLAFLFLMALCTAPPAAHATLDVGFVPGTEDVPLMPGLAPAGGPPLVFDKPQGRIVETTVWGSVSRRAVLSFYSQSLPQLGWARTSNMRFEREGEKLSLDFSGHDGSLSVDFTLAPL